MKKTLWSLLALLTVLSLLMTACNNSQAPQMTAEEILKKSQEQAANMKSAQFKMVMDMEASGMQISLNADGAVETPDKMYMKMVVMEQSIEMLMLSANEAYMNTGSGWEAMPTADLGNSGMSTGMVTDQSELMKYFKNLKNINVEQVGGVNCYHISFDIDLMKALELAMTEEISSLVGEMSGTTSGEVWIGVEDFLTRKMVLKMDLEVQGQSMDFTMTMEMFDINKPVTFPNPN